jgi:uncharacterized membrane protein YphA (DoxX/SURF4 family)
MGKIFSIDLDELSRLGATYGPLVLRVSLAIVFLYFGIAQLRNPESFIGWLPGEIEFLYAYITPRTFVVLNGGFETLCGTLLLIGLFTRISALLLGGHLLGITITIGLTEIGIRDFGLALATFVIVMIGAGPWSLESLFDPVESESLRATNNTQEQHSEQYNQQYPPRKY